MNWWIRYTLGLPARSEDVKEMQKVIPELFSDSWKPDVEAIERRVCFPIWLPKLILHNTNELMMWAKKPTEHTTEHDSRQIIRVSGEICPAPDCPLRSESGRHVEADEEEPFVLLGLMVAGGGNKPPKEAFLDLVRKVHGSTGDVKEVILTDRYILSDVGEDKATGGFANIIEYLETLGLTKKSSFTLRICPNPKLAKENAQEIFSRNLSQEFPKASVDKHASRFSFHDRFYLVRACNSQIKGVFGPSLNGLNSESIVLMGEIEQASSIKKLTSFVESY